MKKCLLCSQSSQSPDHKTSQKGYGHSAQKYYEQNVTGGRLSHIILWMTFLFFMVMMIWAHCSILDEVTRARGQVIPSRKTQVIQNLEGGIIKAILVHEGQVVQRDQVLIQLDPISFSSSYSANRLHILGLKLKVERLQAAADDHSFQPSDQLRQDVPELVSNAESLYESQQTELSQLQERKTLLDKEIRMTAPLIKQGAASAVELLHLKQQRNEIEMRISSFQSTLLRELNETKMKLSRLEENETALKDRLERTEIKSSVKGTIKELYVATIGGVIKPGMAVAEVVPLDDTLLIEARVRPNDIGFLQIGQKAQVKISAYDFSIYGGLKGTIEHISADTSVDRQGQSYYEIWVRTDHNYLERTGIKLNIIPGMQAMVDILTGQKTVLNYLLKPILKTKQNALRER